MSKFESSEVRLRATPDFADDPPTQDEITGIDGHVVFHHYDNIEGNVIIRKVGLDGNELPGSRYELPCSTIFEFVASVVANQRIAHLEQASSNEILGTNLPILEAH